MKSHYLLLFVVLLLAPAVGLGQQGVDPKISRVQELIVQATKLIDQGSPDSLRSAISKLQEAANLSRELREQTIESYSIFLLGNAYHLLGEKKKALEYLERALLAFEQLSEKEPQLASHMIIASDYDDLGETHKALIHYEDALKLSKEMGQTSTTASVLLRLGQFYQSIAQHEKAIESLTQCLQLFKELDNVNAIVAVLKTLGEEYRALGEPEKALKQFNDALPIAIKNNDKSGAAAILHNLGLTYMGLGEYESAKKYYSDSLVLLKENKNKKGEASTLVNIGNIYSNLGKLQEALELNNTALAIFKEIGDKYGEGATLTAIATLHSFLGNKQKALEFFNQALPIRRSVKDLEGEADVLYGIGIVYADLNDYSSANDYLLKAIPLARRIQNKELESVILTNLASGFSAQGNLRMGTALGKEAINLQQDLRQAIRGMDTEIQKSYQRRMQVPYKYLSATLLRQNRLTEAIQVLNISRDQQNFDAVIDKAERPNQLIYTKREEKFSKTYADAANKVSNLGKLIDDFIREVGLSLMTIEQAEKLQQLESGWKKASDELIDVFKQARNEFADTRDKSDEVPEALDQKQMQKALRDLNGQTGEQAAIVYTSIETNGLFEIIITPEKISSVFTAVSGKALDQKAKDFVNNIKLLDRNNKPKVDVTDQAKELYNFIFKPVEKIIPPGTSTIMWLLDNNLRYVPIAALHDGKDYLVHRNINNVVFTRVDPERFTRPLHPVWKATVLANSAAKKNVRNLGVSYDFPELIAIESELENIFRPKAPNKVLLDADILTNLDFTKTAMLTALAKKNPVVHISSHFSIKSGDIARSFLLLGDGSAFSLLDMKRENNLFEGVDLLTLSACNTALDEGNADGQEVDGFAELSQRAGAASVIATLWSVNECSSAELMKLFYQNKVSGKMTKARALREAQLSLYAGKLKLTSAGCKAKNPGNDNNADSPTTTKELKAFKENPARPFEHPYYWSSFVLYGNWQ